MTRTALLLTLALLLIASLVLAAPRPAFLALTPADGESYGRSEVEYVPSRSPQS